MIALPLHVFALRSAGACACAHVTHARKALTHCQRCFAHACLCCSLAAFWKWYREAGLTEECRPGSFLEAQRIKAAARHHLAELATIEVRYCGARRCIAPCVMLKRATVCMFICSMPVCGRLNHRHSTSNMSHALCSTPCLMRFDGPARRSWWCWQCMSATRGWRPELSSARRCRRHLPVASATTRYGISCASSAHARCDCCAKQLRTAHASAFALGDAQRAHGIIAVAALISRRFGLCVRATGTCLLQVGLSSQRRLEEHKRDRRLHSAHAALAARIDYLADIVETCMK
jgi:hypothetical protein